jgi:dolichyl-phosphate-mannose--protein O-mannosyl transferase
MGRILYFHHYFPALLFSSMMSGNFGLTPRLLCVSVFSHFSLFILGVVIDYLVESIPELLPSGIRNSAYHMLVGVIVSALVYRFIQINNPKKIEF